MARITLSGRPQKVVWAVDAFHEDPRSQLRALQTFLKVSGKAPSSVQPVAVLHPGSFDPQSRTFPVEWRKLASAALENLIDALEPLCAAGIEPVRLLRVKGGRVSTSVDALIAFAIENDASLILVGSHGRAGIERLALGSFSETLVLRSPMPVMVVNPKVRAHTKVGTLLFPTDLSPASRKGFDRLLPLAKRYGMPVLLFHKLPLPLSNTGGTFLIPPVSAESLRERKKAASHAAGQWVRLAERQGVRAKAHIDATPGRVLDAVLATARRLGKPTAIAMTSQSGPWQAALGGSLARQILRSTDSPVLIVHANQPSFSRRFLEELAPEASVYDSQPVLI